MKKTSLSSLVALGLAAAFSQPISAASCPQSALGGWWYGTINVINSADTTKNYVGNCVYQFDKQGNLQADGNQSYCIAVSSDPVLNGSTNYVTSGSLVFASGSCTLTGSIAWKAGGVSSFKGHMNSVGKSVVNGTFLNSTGGVGTIDLTK